MRILYVCCEPPDAPSTGSIIQPYHFLRLLRGHHTMGVFALASPSETERLDRLRALCDWVATEPPIPRRPIRNRARWMLSDDPMARWGFPSPQIAGSIDRAIADFKPDIVQFEQLHVAHPLLQLARSQHRPRLIFNAHDALHVMLDRSLIGDSTRGVGRFLNRLFVKRVRDLEYKIATAADAVLCVSQIDARVLRLPELAKKFYVTPNGVDTEFYQPLPAKPASSPPTLVFVGHLGYGPNTDAIQLYAEKIHPILRAAKPDLRLIAVGPVPQELERHRGMPGIEFSGFVRDIRPYFEQADVSIVPLRSGSGTRFKIVESWAMGRAVVSTTIGAEGLPFVDGQNILIADDPEAFAAATLRTLDDPGLAVRLAESGRELVEREFSWRRIVSDLRGYYEQLAPAAFRE